LVALSTFSNLKRLENLHVFRLQTLGAFHDVELNCLSLLQGAEAVRLDGGEMYEYILAALTGDKAKALCVVKPLHCSLFHFVVPLFLFEAERIVVASGRFASGG
jgi:hypothetical protein